MFNVSERNIRETLVVCTALLLISKATAEGLKAHIKYILLFVFAVLGLSKQRNPERWAG